MTLREMSLEAGKIYSFINSFILSDETEQGIMESEKDKVLMDNLEGLGVDDKLKVYCEVIKQTHADAQMFKAEELEMQKKRRQCENKIEWMKDNLKAFMESIGKENGTMKVDIYSITCRESKKVDIVDEELLPLKYLKPQPPKIDKVRIRHDIDEGKTVDGAELVTTRSVTVK